MKIDNDNRDLYIKALLKFFAGMNLLVFIVSICMFTFFHLTEDMPWSMMGDGLIFMFSMINVACGMTVFVVIPILSKLKLIKP